MNATTMRHNTWIQLILFITLIFCVTLFFYQQDIHQESQLKSTTFISKDNVHTTLPFQIYDINNLCDPAKTFKKHTKVLSYCSFGTNPKYLSGIPKVIKNKRNSLFYKDWVVRVYHDGKIPKDMLEKIEGQEDVQLCNANNLPHYGNLSNVFGMFWRFLPMADPTVDVFCSRDLDSNLLLREEDAMKEFMDSDAVLHGMRDNPSHDIALLGGMWCYKNQMNRAGGKYYLERILNEAKKVKVKEDQTILNKVIWGHANKMQDLGMGNVMHHDSYLCKRFGNARPFPKKRRPDDYFVGRPRSEGSLGNPAIKKHLLCPVVCRPSYGQDWENC